MANEVLEEMKRKKKSCVFFKVDYEKTYDSISWEFIYYMLESVGFCDKWIEACLEFASMFDDFLRQVHRVVRSNNVSLRIDIKPIRNS